MRKKRFSQSDSFDEEVETGRERSRGKGRVSRTRERKTAAAPVSALQRLNNLEIAPMTNGQIELFATLSAKQITMVFGCAGTGKSYIATYFAARALAEGRVSKIILTRVMATVGRPIGFLPGTEVDKITPYLAPMLEYLSEFFGKEEVQKMIKADIIQLVPVALLRGYTFKNAYIIVDEAQNTSVHEFKTILTRIGEDSTMAVLGDTDQSDVGDYDFMSGMEDFEVRLSNRMRKFKHADTPMEELSPFIGIVELGIEDVVRSEVVKDILDVYTNY